MTFQTLKPPKFFWKKDSLKNLKLEEQLFVKWLSILIFCIKVYLVKISLIFDGSTSSCLTIYQQILSVCSFRCKIVLYSTTVITLLTSLSVHTSVMYVRPYVHNPFPVTCSWPFRICCLLVSWQTNILPTHYPLSPPWRG